MEAQIEEEGLQLQTGVGLERRMAEAKRYFICNSCADISKLMDKIITNCTQTEKIVKKEI